MAKNKPSESMLWRIHKKPLSERQVNHLLGIVGGIMADDILQIGEVDFLHQWLKDNYECREEYPAKQIYGELERIFADGVVTAEELHELEVLLRRIVPKHTPNTSLQTPSVPFDSINEHIDFLQSSFCFSGEFAFGKRKSCEEATLALGGLVQANITKSLDYLIIGEFSSPFWLHESFGTKIRKAVKYRDEHFVPLRILPEGYWLECLETNISELGLS